jgi:hypothetical protein
MIIDLQKTVIRTQMRRFITLIVFVIIIIFVVLMGNLQTQYFGLSKYQWAIIISFLYLAASIIESVLNLHYIFYSDEGDVIILRYFSMSFFNKKKNSIEIPNKDFRGYAIEKKLNGFQEFIILYQDFKGKEAKYPAVNITALSKVQKDKLIASLEKNKLYAASLKF